MLRPALGPTSTGCGCVTLSRRTFLLSEYVAPDGVIAVFSDRSLWTAYSPWQRAARRAISSG